MQMQGPAPANLGSDTLDTGSTVAAGSSPRFGRAATTRHLLFLLAVLLTGVSLCLFAYYAVSQRRQALNEAERITANTAEVLAEHAGRVFDASNLLASQAVALAAGKSWDEISQSYTDHQFLLSLSNTLAFVSSLWLTDQAGMPRLTSRAFPAPRIDASDREHFIKHRERDQGPVISTLLRSRVSGRTNIVMSRRVGDEAGNFRGIAQVVIEPTYFFDFYEKLDLGFPVEVNLFRDDLSVIIRYPPLSETEALDLKKWSNLNVLRRNSIKGTHIVASPADGVERIESYRHIKDFPLYVSVGIDRADVLTRWTHQMILEGAFVAIALAALLTLLGFAYQRTLVDQRISHFLDQRVRQRTAQLERALKEKDLLLKEVDHRVKNSLQFVSNLLDLQARLTAHSEIREELVEANRRVLAIAQVHRRLYQDTAIDTVDFGRYLRDLCRDLEQNLSPSPSVKLVVDADSAELPIGTVTSLGLIVNELVANAFKHAYPQPGTEDRIEVGFRRTGAASYEIAVRDYGVGLSGEFGADGSGLGAMLVRMLAQQINGRLDIARGSTGTSFRLEFDAAA
jgi:two-component sensor histidine kinase